MKSIATYSGVGPIAALVGLFIAVCGLWIPVADAAVINKSLCVSALTKTMKDGVAVTFWGYTESCSGMGMGGGSVGQVPGPLIEVGIGDTLNLALSVNMMTPQETSPYNGHTIHMHGADVATGQDGVPETNGNQVNGATYIWTPTAEMAGSYMYHCHVHTVKHLDMGMYGPLIARPKDAAGNFLNQLTADPKTAYDVAQYFVFSTVDPAYHAEVGDSPVFSHYTPKYFLINGNEGNVSTDPAVTVSAAVNQKVALRLIGLHAVSGTFSIRDGAGKPQPFTVYVEDGRQWPAPETVTQLDIGSGQRFDIVFTAPATSGAWYPQMAYKKLRDGGVYTTTYAKVTF
jgi:FtsP/CotA-like multicopper oxidase with cupredoxin domain